MNQLSTGPGGGGGGLMRVADARRLQAAGRRLAVRAVNLNWHVSGLGLRNLTHGWWRDRQTVALLNAADMAIFQSDYQRQFFRRAGYRGRHSVIIHNGAARTFWAERLPNQPLNGPLRVISSTASPRPSKRHDLIARLAACDGVESWHLGVWPAGLPSGKVRFFGVQSREAMLQAMAQCHYFLHPAVKDPCPNAVFEAVCAGLPVIYNAGPGSSVEIVGNCGFALEEGNLAQTVAQARELLDILRQTVQQERDRFSITHAATRYRAAFEQLATPGTCLPA